MGGGATGPCAFSLQRTSFVRSTPFEDHHCTVQGRRSCDFFLSFCLLFLGPCFGSLFSGLTCVYSMKSSLLSYSDCPLNAMYGFRCLFYNGG